jgi:heme/copper-type cytochrome/quinol oxidase subunit 2
VDKHKDQHSPIQSFYTERSKLVNKANLSLLALIGLPTHHSKLVAFQTPATPIMEGIVDLHNDIMFFLTFIVVFVFYLLVQVVINFSKGDKIYLHGKDRDNITHNTLIEVI